MGGATGADTPPPTGAPDARSISASSWSIDMLSASSSPTSIASIPGIAEKKAFTSIELMPRSISGTVGSISSPNANSRTSSIRPSRVRRADADAATVETAATGAGCDGSIDASWSIDMPYISSSLTPRDSPPGIAALNASIDSMPSSYSGTAASMSSANTNGFTISASSAAREAGLCCCSCAAGSIRCCCPTLGDSTCEAFVTLVLAVVVAAAALEETRLCCWRELKRTCWSES